MSLSVEIRAVRRPTQRARPRYRWQLIWNGTVVSTPARFATPTTAKKDLGQLILELRNDDFPVHDLSHHKACS